METLERCKKNHPDPVFWAKVEFDGDCWKWNGSQNGIVRFRKKLEYAHRVMWFLAHGAWPRKGRRLTCLHACCVNPDHSYWPKGDRSLSRSEDIDDRIKDFEERILLKGIYKREGHWIKLTASGRTQPRMARRVFEFYKGIIPIDSFLRRMCGHPECVNPEHHQVVPYAEEKDRQDLDDLSPAELKEHYRLIHARDQSSHRTPAEEKCYRQMLADLKKEEQTEYREIKRTIPGS